MLTSRLNSLSVVRKVNDSMGDDKVVALGTVCCTLIEHQYTSSHVQNTAGQPKKEHTFLKATSRAANQHLLMVVKEGSSPTVLISLYVVQQLEAND